MPYISEENVNDIFIDENGELVFLSDLKFYKYGTSITQVTGNLESGDSDLGEPNIDKVVESITAQYKGAFTLGVYLDGTLQYALSFPYTSTRQTLTLFALPQYRIASEKIRFKIESTTNITEIYNLQLDYIILPRRRGIP